MFSGDPGAVDSRGRYKTWDGANVFQTSMMNAPCVNFPTSCCWCMGYVYPSPIFSILLDCFRQYNVMKIIVNGSFFRWMFNPLS